MYAQIILKFPILHRNKVNYFVICKFFLNSKIHHPRPRQRIWHDYPGIIGVFLKSNTEKNTVISPNLLVWKFCGKAQIPHSFRRIAVPFDKIPTPKNLVKLRYFSQWKVNKNFKILHYANNYIVGNKTKRRISKQMFQENKARQYFRKTNIRCVYQGLQNVSFSKNLTCFVFWKHPFWDSPLCLITDDMEYCYKT